MTNEQILKKAIYRAMDNGWKVFSPYDFVSTPFYNGKQARELYVSHLIAIWKTWIFDHDFAKAFWGEEAITICCNVPREKYQNRLICKECGNYKFDFDCEIAWMVHIQQMVLQKEPLKYLEKFLI